MMLRVRVIRGYLYHEPPKPWKIVGFGHLKTSKVAPFRTAYPTQPVELGSTLLASSEMSCFFPNRMSSVFVDVWIQKPAPLEFVRYLPRRRRKQVKVWGVWSDRWILCLMFNVSLMDV